MEKYLVRYPVPDKFESLFHNPNKIGINDLTELQHLITGPKLGISGKKFKPQPHQELFSRLMSVNTCYTEILLLAEPGTGKSLESIIAAYTSTISTEAIRYKKPLFLVPNDSIKNKFIMEIANRIGDKKYMSYEKNADLRMRRIRAMVLRDFEISTHQKFAKYIAGSSNERIIKDYSGRFIVFDEIQNVRRLDKTAKGSGGTTYQSYFRFFHLVQNCTKVLMSGTPLKDLPDEIADVMNLILPLDQQMPTDKEYYRYFYKNGEIIPERYNPYFKNRVSYLKASYSDTKRDFQGTILKDVSTNGDLPYRVYTCEMSSHQLKEYRRAYARDSRSGDREGDDREEKETASAVYHASRAASNFVFPSGTSSSTYFKNDEIPIIRKQTRFYKDIFGDSTDHAEMLAKLEKYSKKYAETIRLLLYPIDKSNNSELARGTMFVYNTSVNNGGCITFAACLAAFGFSPYTHIKHDKNVKRKARSIVELGKARRYALITGGSYTKAARDQLFRYINDPLNADGEYIKVIIGSDAIATGLDVFNAGINVSHAPYWNLAISDQAIARVFRVGSDTAIREMYPDFDRIRIYMMASIDADRDLSKSIEYRMYNIALKKDLEIKKIERLLKTSAIDAVQNYGRNAQQPFFEDFSRYCEYGKCEFVPTVAKAKQQITSNYNILYSEEDIKTIWMRLQILFYQKGYYNIFSLNHNLRVPDKDLIRKAITLAIQQTKHFYNMYGVKCFVRESENMVYLVENPASVSDKHSGIYNEIPFLSINNKITIENSIEASDIKRMCGDKVLFEQTIHHLPENIIREFIEGSFIAYNHQKVRDNSMVDVIKTRFFSLVKNYKDNKYILVYGNKNPRCIDLDSGDPKWEKCSKDIENEISHGIEEKLKELEKYPYYGVIQGTAEEFKIRSIMRGKRTSGKVCKHYKKTELIEIAKQLGIELKSTKTIDICSQLEKGMIEKGMVIRLT